MIYLGLLLFFVLEYVRPSNAFPWMARANSIVPILVSLGAIVASGRVTNADVFEAPATRSFLVFMGLLLLSVLTTDVTWRAVDITWAVIGYMLIYWAIAKTVTSFRLLKGLFFALVLTHVVIAALNPQIFTSGEREYMVAGTFLEDGNDFALSVNIVLPLCLFLMLDTRRTIARLFYGALTLFLVLCIVVTQSRGGTLALICVGVVYWTTSRQKVRIGLAAAAAVTMIMLVAPPAYFGRMQDLTNTEEGSAHGRIEAWTAGTKMAGDSPLLGVGAGMFAVMYGAKYGSPIGPQTAHSIYFLILGELGVPGFVWLVVHILTQYAANHRLRRQLVTDDAERWRREALLMTSTGASLVAYATGGAFLSAVYSPHIYVVTALLVVSRRIVHDELSAVRTAVAATSPPVAETSLHWALRPRAAAVQRSAR